MFSVSNELYEHAACLLKEAIADKGYFSGRLDFTFGQTDCTLILSAVVSHHTLSLPEGDRTLITDLVPVWWEFHTSSIDGACDNDFSFEELRTWL